MIDLSLNSNYSVHLDDTNDLATVEGRDAFEQSVVWDLTQMMHEDLPGLTGQRDTTKQKIRMVVNRVARRHDMVTGIAQLDIQQKNKAEDTYQVEIVYTSDQMFSTEISA